MSIPYGYCQCGCGEMTNRAPQAVKRFGMKKGDPFRYITGHNAGAGKPDYLVDDATGCWNWNRSNDGCHGYGRKMLGGGRRTMAHRWVYEQHKGPIPEGLQLDHLCRNRRCVNPDHLEPVTCRENVRRGIATKLTDEDVAEIRASRELQKELAARFGIAQSYVSRIKAGLER